MKKKLIIISIILVLLSSLVLYSRYIGTTGLITKEYKVIADIEESYDGLKIVHFSDLHYGRILTEKRLNNLIDEINLIKPDIVVFTGDLIDQDAVLNNDDLNVLTKKISSIKAKLNKYAILGNDDYNYDKEKIKTIFKNSDFIVLENESDIIYNENNDKIFIGGIDTNNIDSYNSTFDNINDINYKIIIMHAPDYTDEILKNYNNINLILAGHSHNGQIRVPLIGAIFLPDNAKKYYDNYYKINETDLYISSGIGVSKYNFRLFNRPSINFYRINKKTS